MKYLSRLLLGCVVLASFALGQESEVIAIGIGEKNSTFDESVFKNIKIYYTPSVKVEKKALGEKSFSGSPKFLTSWFNTTGEPNDFFVMGSNNVVYDQGKSIIAGSSMLDVETERKGTFKKAIAMVSDKERTIRESRKEIDVEDEKGFVKRKLPAFALADVNGNTVSSSSVIDNGVPKLILFFYLDPDKYIGVEKDDGTEVRSKEYMRGRMESASGVESVRALIQVERELYGNIVHDIY